MKFCSYIEATGALFKLTTTDNSETYLFYLACLSNNPNEHKAHLLIKCLTSKQILPTNLTDNTIVTIYGYVDISPSRLLLSNTVEDSANKMEVSAKVTRIIMHDQDIYESGAVNKYIGVLKAWQASGLNPDFNVSANTVTSAHNKPNNIWFDMKGKKAKNNFPKNPTYMSKETTDIDSKDLIDDIVDSIDDNYY